MREPLFPEDFNDFWNDLLCKSSKIPLNETCEKIELRSSSKTDVSLVHYDSIDNIRIAGWYCLPHNTTSSKKKSQLLFICQVTLVNQKYQLIKLWMATQHLV